MLFVARILNHDVRSAMRGEPVVNATKFRQIRVRFAPEFLGCSKLLARLGGVACVFCNEAKRKVSSSVSWVVLDHVASRGFRQIPVAVPASALGDGFELKASGAPSVRTRATQDHLP